jgi:asparagine synthase (glutamine-hydrolysing)
MLDKSTRNHYIFMRERYGWKLYQNDNIKLWFCGYQYNSTIDDMLRDISSILYKNSTDKYDILNWIKDISGHFAIVIETTEWVVVAVDKICTIPIFIVNRENNIFISNHAPILKKECNIGKADLDQSAGLEVAMSGYTIGSKTLYHKLERLEAGECLLSHKGLLFRDFYYTYYPCKTRNSTNKQLKKDFTDVCINTLVNLKNSSDGRQIVIPLSAGNDSRAIASGLKELGVKNVICFSYGRNGNFETPISKVISEKLGYKWLHIPVSMKDKRSFFKSDVYHKYITEFESYGAIPNIQEVYEISLLKQNPLVDDDAIIVNGNTGDFISGGHVNKISDVEYMPKNISEINWDYFLQKHYSLWEDLRFETNDSYIVSELKKILFLRFTTLIDFEKCHYSIMECLECIGRQSKYVAAQQRTYEYFGYEWRLPLWSDEMLDFWEHIPYKYKFGQNLYIETLRENNWGGVWLDTKANDKKINPCLLRWTRTFFKIFFIPIGKSKWHRFERNALKYFIHPSYALTIVPYLKILFDYRGYRSKDSWLSYKMLKSEGLENNSWIKK